MPRNRDYDDFDDEDDEDEDERQPRKLEGDALIRHLRKQVKDRDKRLNEVEARLDKYEKAERRSSVEEVLKAAEVNTKYARWIIRDLEETEPTKENILKWLDENADLVGIEPKEDTTVGEETQQNLRRIQGSDKSSKGPDADPIAAALSDPNLTPEKLEALIGKSLG